jgi:hypothetical protein
MDFEGRHKSTDTTSLRDLLSRLSTKSGAEDLQADEERKSNRNKISRKKFDNKVRKYDSPARAYYNKHKFDAFDNLSYEEFLERYGEFRPWEMGSDDDSEERVARDDKYHYPTSDAHDHDAPVYEHDGDVPNRRNWGLGRRQERANRPSGAQERNYRTDGKADGGAAFDVASRRSSDRRDRKLAEYSRKNDEMYGGTKTSRDSYKKFYGLDH